jgi:aromatic ring-opening dioxygenase LigB subunit
MLVFTGFIPSSPLLLSSVNPDSLDKLKDTNLALNELNEELYASHPDTLVLISSHLTMYDEAFSINVADPYVGDLTEVGDLGYNENFHPDFDFIDRLQRHLRRINLPITLTTDERLNAPTSVALKLLSPHLANLKVVLITPSQLDAKQHFAFGSMLKHIIIESQRRIAVIAAGDLSHALTKESPAGYQKAGKMFDATLLDILKEKNTSGLLQLPEEILENSYNSCYRQLCILFGVLDGFKTHNQLLSYQAPFGVGLAVVNFGI